MTDIWGIHAGGPRSDFITTGVIVLERPGVRDLRLVGNDRDAVKAELAASYPEAKAGTVAAWTGVLLRFAFGPSVGDLVVHPERATRTVSLGYVASDYYWEQPGRHCRVVRWLARRLPRDEFVETAQREVSARVAFFRVPDAAGEFAGAASRARAVARC